MGKGLARYISLKHLMFFVVVFLKYDFVLSEICLLVTGDYDAIYKL